MCYKMIHWYVHGSKNNYERTQNAVDKIYTYALNNPGTMQNMFTMVHEYMIDTYSPPPASQPYAASISLYKLKF